MQVWPLDSIRIVLVEPAGPLNLGATARIMKNMGLHRLVLVNPRCDPGDPLACQMAVHADDVLAAASVVSSLVEALAGCQRAVATTGRLHPQNQPLELPETALPWLLPATPQTNWGAALIFGPEDRGLSNEELVHAQRWVRIPASQVYPSLNLAQAVGVCSYLLRRSALLIAEAGAGPDESGYRQADLTADLNQVEEFYQDLEAILLRIGYLYPHTASPRMAKLRQLLNRADPTQKELAMLRGVLRQMTWALTARQD
ncbi:MAG: RNA methyltransferase [Cyanobacteria bacterium REEB459]|nr:RNA methyltransferase [Cyanobacteria bacterium REEB459]